MAKEEKGREKTFFAKENARLRKLKREKAKNKSGWFGQPRRFPKKGSKKRSEKIASKFGETAEDRAREVIALAPLVHGPWVLRLTRQPVRQLNKEGVLEEAFTTPHTMFLPRSARPGGSVKKAKGGLIKSSRKKSKSIDGIARKGHTRAKHR